MLSLRVQGHSKTRELDTPDLLEQLPALQQTLYRLLNCQPEGAATSNFVIEAALGLVRGSRLQTPLHLLVSAVWISELCCIDHELHVGCLDVL